MGNDPLKIYDLYYLHPEMGEKAWASQGITAKQLTEVVNAGAEFARQVGVPMNFRVETIEIDADQ